MDVHVSCMIRGWDIRASTTGSMVLDSARRAESIGLDGLLAGDHVTFYGFGFDGLQTLTAVAAVTERITLKTAVYLLPLRHVMPVALQVAALRPQSLALPAVQTPSLQVSPVVQNFPSSHALPSSACTTSHCLLVSLQCAW